MTKEEKFYNALKDVFIGAKVEGESGFINLMKIKSTYYEEGVFPCLIKDVEKGTKPFPTEFKEELYDKLYTFFNRYFSESGSIYFRYTPLHQNIYEKVYTDDKDVMLFWKTHMLYYVKTDRMFNSMPVELDGVKFFFDVSTLEYKKANERKEVVYEMKEVKKDGIIVFNVYYSERGRITKLDEIIKVLKKQEIAIDEEQLEQAFRIFEKQNEVDYFINKDAKKFLKEQFDIWLYQYVFSGESKWTEMRIKELQALKTIAYKIIDFISQFEDELVKIWNKPKFVLNSNYVITLDRIASKDITIIEKLLKHKNLSEQVQEWKELNIIEDFKKEDVLEKDLHGKRLKNKYQSLPIDTKYFKELELEILGLFDDLDNSLDGWLIKSENYQALNTILPKFKNKVQTIYIDPPFNLDSSDQFLYRTNYKDANWATLLENRLKLAKDILDKKGNIFVKCDYNGNMFVRLLLNDILGGDNFRNEIVVSRISKQDSRIKKLNNAIDYIFFYSKSELFGFNMLLKKLKKPKEERWHSLDAQGQGESQKIFGFLFAPPKGRHWMYGNKNMKEAEENQRIRIVCKICKYVHISGEWKGCPNCKNLNKVRIEYKLSPSTDKPIDTNWTDIPGYTSSWDFATENSERSLFRCIKMTSNEKNIIFDFFLGSGTTTAVAHKLGRKWIGVEMGEHFYNVVLRRMKKVLAYDKSGISKDVKEYQGGGFFKYYELEQYEDVLKKVKYESSELFDNTDDDPYSQYVFMKDKKLLEVLDIDYKKNKVEVDLDKLYKNIDVPETLSNLLGKYIKKVTENSVEFENGEKVNLKDLDYKLIKPLIWW